MSDLVLVTLIIAGALATIISTAVIALAVVLNKSAGEWSDIAKATKDRAQRIGTQRPPKYGQLKDSE